MTNDGNELSCNHCGHVWPYKGKRTYYACCPNCRGNVKLNREQGETQKEAEAGRE